MSDKPTWDDVTQEIMDMANIPWSPPSKVHRSLADVQKAATSQKVRAKARKKGKMARKSRKRNRR